MLQPAGGTNASQRTFCFLSQILGKRVYGKDHVLLGKVQDLIATASERYPEIEGLVVVRRGQTAFVPARSRDFIALAGAKSLELSGVEPTPVSCSERQFLVRDTLLDKQIVDINGAKVERVNDVQILVYADKPFLVHVDVGFTGLSRRLGIEGGIRSLARAVGRPLKDELIGWKFVQTFPEAERGPVQITLRQEQMSQLHAGELADIIEELDRDERLALVRSIDVEDAADALEEADLAVQTSVLRELDSELAADILEEMEPAVAADVIEELPAEAQQSIMAAMEEPERAELSMLAAAEEDTAAQLMTVDFVSCPESSTAVQALDTVRANASDIESITYVYCLDADGALAGVVSLRDLIIADGAQVLSEIMHRRLATLRREDDWGKVADEFWKYRFKALPVVSTEGKMEGIVTFMHSFDELLPHYHKLAS